MFAFINFLQNKRAGVWNRIMENEEKERARKIKITTKGLSK
jgi:hypothetical protein